VTFREQGHQTHKKAGTSLDTASVISVDHHGDKDGHGGLVEIDLLGGLASGQWGFRGSAEHGLILLAERGVMPANRLGPSTRQDLSLPPLSPVLPIARSAVSPITAPSYPTPTTASSGPSRERAHLPNSVTPVTATTLRKSYRRVLSLCPGLRVRMRNLVLPQLLVSNGANGVAGDDVRDGQSERRVVLCVEVENTLEGDAPHSFEVEDVAIDIGGKGGQATAELVCQPDETVFPRKLRPAEQYNLLYAVSIASAPAESPGGVDEAVARSLGTGETSRPVSITVTGRPYDEDSGHGGIVFPTKTFHSRWNCTLDLALYFAGQSSAPVNLTSPQHAHSARNRNRHSKPTTATPPPNAIAGDKRYSLASLLTPEQPSPSLSSAPFPQRPGSQRLVSGTTQKPLMPSQLMAGPSGRVPSTHMRGQPGKASDEGLLVSVKLLPQADESHNADGGADGDDEAGGGVHAMGGVRALEPFSIEVFVHNRTDEVRRFRLSVPVREGKSASAVDRRRPQSGGSYVDDPGEWVCLPNTTSHLHARTFPTPANNVHALSAF
jgi:hypothetical protein